MSYVNELHDRLKRAKAMKKWPDYFKKLKKKKGLSRAAWCQNNGLDTTQIGHAISGRRGLTVETYNKIVGLMAAEFPEDIVKVRGKTGDRPVNKASGKAKKPLTHKGRTADTAVIQA